MARGSSIIKADGEATTAQLGLRSFQLNDVLIEARQTVTAARQEATALGEQARHQATLLYEKARQEGHAQGLAEGRKAGQQAGRQEAFDAARQEFIDQQKTLIATCQDLVGQVNSHRADWQAAARQDLVDLAMAIARRVVGQVGQRERDAVYANLEEAVRLAGKRSEVTIQVSPTDAAAARSFAKCLVDQRDEWQHVHVVEQPDITPGGCRVVWGSGMVDATLELQLDRIAQELGARMENEESPDSWENASPPPASGEDEGLE